MHRKEFTVAVHEEVDAHASIPRLRRVALAAMRGLSFPKGLSLAIVVVSGAHMRRLNKEWRGHDKIVSVLAFPLWDGKDQEGLLGEIYLCPEGIRTFAKERGIGFSDALAWLLVHGIVHLAGYDHVNDKEAAAMERVENKILESLSLKRATKSQ